MRVEVKWPDPVHLCLNASVDAPKDMSSGSPDTYVYFWIDGQCVRGSVIHSCLVSKNQAICCLEVV